MSAPLPWWQQRMVCKARPSAVTEVVHRRTWRPPADSGLTHLAVHSAIEPTGWMFTEERGSTFNGASMWNVRTGEHRRIRAFTDPRQYQAAGGFDGRYVLWQETHSLESFDDFGIYTYDLKTGTSRHIGDSLRDSQGDPYVSVLDAPTAENGMGVWVQGSGPARRQVKVIDLATGAVRILDEGRINGASLRDGVVTVFHGDLSRTQWDVHTAKRLPTPEWLTELEGIPMLGVYGTVATSMDSLDGRYGFFQITPDSGLRPLVSEPRDFGLQNVPRVVSRHLASYPTQGHGVWVVDLQRGVSFPISTSQMSFGRNDRFVTVDANPDKAAQSTSIVIVDIDRSRISANMCDSTTPIPTVPTPRPPAGHSPPPPSPPPPGSVGPSTDAV
ncbi:hypothetical protein ACQP1U_09135 [Actinomycetota bacterium]